MLIQTYRKMNETDEIDKVTCECNMPIKDEIMMNVYEERCADLKKWKNFPETSPNYKKQLSLRKYKCMKEHYVDSMDMLRRLDCEHDYCEECLIKMMKEYIRGPPIKCSCGEPIPKEVLEGVNKEAYDKYMYAYTIRGTK